MDKNLCHRPTCDTQSGKLSLPVEIVEAKGHQLGGKTIIAMRAEMDFLNEANTEENRLESWERKDC